MVSVYVFVFPSLSVNSTFISWFPDNNFKRSYIICDKSSVVVSLNTNFPSMYTAKCPFVKFKPKMLFKMANVN